MNDDGRAMTDIVDELRGQCLAEREMPHRADSLTSQELHRLPHSFTQRHI